MAVELLMDAPAGTVSPILNGRVSIRPSKTDYYPINVTLSGSVAGDTTAIYVSPSLESTTDWHLLFTLTVPGPGGYNDHAYNQILYAWERVKAIAGAGNAGLVRCFMIPLA